jgi:hypothetical protein
LTRHDAQPLATSFSAAAVAEQAQPRSASEANPASRQAFDSIESDITPFGEVTAFGARPATKPMAMSATQKPDEPANRAGQGRDLGEALICDLDRRQAASPTRAKAATAATGDVSSDPHPLARPASQPASREAAEQTIADRTRPAETSTSPSNHKATEARPAALAPAPPDQPRPASKQTSSAAAVMAWHAPRRQADSAPMSAVTDRRGGPAMAPPLAASRATAEPRTVNVTIGRVEVRAVAPTTPAKSAPPRNAQTPTPLDQYLHRSNRGGRA